MNHFNHVLSRSNSIDNVKKQPLVLKEESSTLKRKKRARSLHDLSRTEQAAREGREDVTNKQLPVKEMCRMFELRGSTEVKLHLEVRETEAEVVTTVKNTGGGGHLNQRRLQRGERRLCKLRLQIMEVEEEGKRRPSGRLPQLDLIWQRDHEESGWKYWQAQDHLWIDGFTHPDGRFCLYRQSLDAARTAHATRAGGAPSR